jgi:hypothetical protein
MNDIEKTALLKVRAAEKMRGEVLGTITESESRAATKTVHRGTYDQLCARGWIVWSNGYHTTEEGRLALARADDPLRQR